MNSIRKYLNQVVGEEDDEMEVDHNFTQRYLSQFPTIDRQTIDVMLENGYEDRETLLAFDLKEDLPSLPDLNMAQKSLLRKVLKQLHESQDWESKVNEIKGTDDDMAFDTLSLTRSQLKRKSESTVRLSPQKRSKTSEVAIDLDASTRSPIAALNDGLGPRMRQLVRKSIRNTNPSDFESDLETEVNAKRFEFASNNRRSRLSRSANTSRAIPVVDINETEVDDEEEQEDDKPSDERYWSQQIGSVGSLRSDPFVRLSRTPRAEPTPDSVSNSTSKANRRTTRTANPRVPATRLSIGIKAETTGNTTPVQSRAHKEYVPTPTELEVRERLEQKKALKAKGTRKRRI